MDKSRPLLLEGKKPKRRRKVLSEDEYLRRLSAILKRDFFPNLVKLEAQYDYLTALERQDYEALRLAADRLAALESKMTTGTHTDDRSSKQGAAPKMSLDEFQAAYVTEDTAAFEELIEKVNATKRAKFIKHHGVAPLLGDDPARRLLLAPSKSENPSRGQVNPANAVLPSKPVDKSKMPLGVTPDDVKYEYWKMVQEYGTAEDDDGKSLAGASTVSGISQYGNVGKHYDFVETPLQSNTQKDRERRFQMPQTPVHPGTSMAKRRELLKSPAVQRLLKSRTPKHTPSVFDVPLTPRRPPNK